MSNGGAPDRRSIRSVRHRPSDASDTSDHRNHRHCFLPNSVHHPSKQGHPGAAAGCGTGMLRVPSSLPSSPSTIITNIEQDRAERDIPMEMAALVVFDGQHGPQNQNRFVCAGPPAGYERPQQGQGGSGSCGHRKHRSATAVLMLMERCSNSSTETFDF
uniref:Uncharacterized protein n=1 Tax=Anopheles melas TaxID=34690 RepID=A0A182TLU9_9DIPT